MSAKGSALKRVRQSKKANERNRHNKSKMNTTIKKFLSSDKKDAKKDFSSVIKMIDQITSKGIIHKNKATRHKSRLNSHVKLL